MEQIHRLLRQVSPTPTGTFRVSMTTLAQELGVNRNTILKDLELLELFNAPLEYDRSRRTYYYTERFELRPPVWLASDESLALLIVMRLAARSRVFPIGRTFLRALQRIVPLLAGTASFGPDQIDAIFSTPEAAIGEREARHFALLCQAIKDQSEVRIVYQKAKHDTSPQTRLVHPLHWFIRPDACLLIVHEPAVHDRRNFELARMQQVELTGATFTAPEGFDLRRHLAGGFGRFIGEPVHAVRVRFTREYVPFVREQPWQPDQQLVENRDGSAEATYHVCHAADLERNILSAGGQAEVLSPPEVRDRIHALATKVREQHR